jgi:predicted cobalt transporter CbtA
MAAFVVSKTISGFLAGRFAGIVFRENLLAPVAGTFLVSVANELIFWIATRAAGGGEATLLILGRSLYTAAVAPVFYVALRRLERRLPAAPPA